MIRTTAETLFLSQGVGNTSVNDIVAAAGIAKGTFYIYFKDRAELIDSVFSAYTARFVKSIITDNINDPRIVKFSKSILAFFSKKPNQLYLSELRKDLLAGKEYNFTKDTVRALNTVITSYLTRSTADFAKPEIYTELLITMTLEICNKAIFEKNILSRQEAESLLYDFFKRFFNCE